MAVQLKVGLVLDDTLDSTDGVQQYVINVGRWLEHRGHDVHYLVGQSHRQDIRNIHSLSRNVRVKFNGNNLSVPLPVKKKLISDVLAPGFDILHVQLPFSPMLAGRIIDSADNLTALIGTFHIAPYNQLSRYGGVLLGAVTKRQIGRFDSVLAVSEPAALMAKQIYRCNSLVIGNCFDFRLFYTAKPYKRAQDRVEILFLGRLVKRKGCQTLLAAIALIERSSSGGLPAYRLTIAGDGPLKTDLELYVDNNGLKDYVRFVGYVDESIKPRYYASTDIAVFPSVGGESFGFVLVEAMASGRAAVVAADNPGYASVLKAAPELLFKAGDSASLAAKLKQLIYHNDLRRRFAQRGQAIARQYDQDIIGQQLIDCYQDALHKRRA